MPRGPIVYGRAASTARWTGHGGQTKGRLMLLAMASPRVRTLSRGTWHRCTRSAPPPVCRVSRRRRRQYPRSSPLARRLCVSRRTAPTLTLSTETRAPRSRLRRKQRNAQAMAAVQQKLEGARLPKESVRTLAYSLDEEYNFIEQSAPARKASGRSTRSRCAWTISPVWARSSTWLSRRVPRSAQNIRFDLKERTDGRTPGAAACRRRCPRPRRGGSRWCQRHPRCRDSHRGTGPGRARATPHDGDDARGRRRCLPWTPVNAGGMGVDAPYC